MAQLRPAQWVTKTELAKFRGAVEAMFRELYEDLDGLQQQVGVVAVGVVNLNTAVLEIQQALFADDEDNEDKSELSQQLMDLINEEPPEPEDNDNSGDLQSDESSPEPVGFIPDDDGTPERQERIRQARQEARAADPIAAFEAANSSSTAEMAAADDDFNAIGGLPDDGILVSPGEPTPGLTDLGGGND